MSVVIEGIDKRYTQGDSPAVHDATLRAASGGVTALLGPSGSGKTTLLRIIAGLETPDRGRISIHGTDVTKTSVRERGLGFVFQGYALFSHLSVRDNIGFGLKLKTLPSREIARRVDELLELVQLRELGQRKPNELSGGQQQRVAFARALAPKPRVLLLDEPFGALDAKVRLELRRWLRALHAQTHVTTLLVTHDQEEALELSDQVVLMNEGRIVQSGTPYQIYDQPVSPFVASFIGNASLLRGSVDDGQAELAGIQLDAPPGIPSGSAVLAYVRAEEVTLARAPQTNVEVSTVRRIASRVEVEVVLADGQRMTVQLSRIEADALWLQAGDRLRLDLGKPRIFLAP
ncbi:MAG: ABC transporter ATP-binding protein [Polyangia bacterium]